MTIYVQSMDEITSRTSTIGKYGQPVPLGEIERQEVVLKNVPAYRCNWCRKVFYSPEVEYVIHGARKYLLPPRDSKSITYDEAVIQLMNTQEKVNQG